MFQGFLKITRYCVTELVSLTFNTFFFFTHLKCALIGKTELLRHVIKEEKKKTILTKQTQPRKGKGLYTLFTWQPEMKCSGTV